MGAARRKARELIDRFGFDLDPDSRIDELPVGLQQQVEVLKALFRDARILIMDEPTAVLTPQETRGLFEFLRGYAAAGNAVVFISHKLDEVMEICDRMSVMRDGRMVGTVGRAETDTRRLASMMVGREVLLRVDKGPAAPAEVRLEARGLRLRHPVKARPILDGVDLAVRAGEIVGIAGIEGNGQTELVEVLTGLRDADAGEVWLDGRDVTGLGARATARGRRVARPGGPQRARPGAAVLGGLERRARRPAPRAVRRSARHARPGAIDAHATAIIDGYDVRPRATGVMASSYSGGNAQKLIMARELERAPRVLVAAQPTRGVDIGAIEFIHRRIVAARDAGLAVLLVSADLNEVMSLADRILVMFEGRVMGELAQAEATAERLGLLMAGAASVPRGPAAAPATRSPGHPPADAALVPVTPGRPPVGRRGPQRGRALLQEAAQVGGHLGELDQEGVVAVGGDDAGVAGVGQALHQLALLHLRVEHVAGDAHDEGRHPIAARTSRRGPGGP
jgi:general nucleoside transport system ATP-binding protein